MKTRLLTTLLLCLSFTAGAQTSLSSLRVNGLDNPLGVSPAEAPAFSWILNASKNNTYQAAYEVTVTSAGRKVWSSGKVESDNSTSVVYGGPIASDTRYDVQVRVWDNYGKASKKISGSWRTGISGSEWKAAWIGRDNQKAPLYFKTSASIGKKVRSATAYVSAHGLYELSIGGVKVGNDYLTPGWTKYSERIQYMAYDVTSMLRKGSNEISAIVAPGWYSGGMNYGKPEKQFRYGTDIALIAQINIEYSDGSKQTICTGSDWQMSEGPVCYATIYGGEDIDLTKEHSWSAATILACNSNLVSTINEPVRVRKVFQPVKVITTPEGDKVIDFGQNIVGWERVRLSGKRGQKVTIRHAEVLDQKGNFYTVNLRGARATSVYTLSGNGTDVFEPTLTFYGFRYIAVSGLEGELNPADFEAVAICSDFEDTGSFDCSNPLVNQLQSNIYWGFHDNYVDIPTDCPQRDERLGWTGDAQVFFRTATFLGKVDNFFNKWLADLSLEQKPNGCVPKIIPDSFPYEKGRVGATGWADAATIIPWDHYMAFGDIKVLANQYESMHKWVDFMIALCKDNNYLYNQNVNNHYGDWLAYLEDNPDVSKTAASSKAMIAQAFFARSTQIVADAAAALDKPADEKYYREVFEKARKAYLEEYVTPNGLICSDTQTSYVLALKFGLLPEELRQSAADRLVKNIERYKDHITTGFLGTPHICNVLTDAGRSDVAYRLLLQKTCPGWLYPVTMGATTIWERWDSIKPNGSIPDNGMNSFNHYSYGAIGDWLYRSAVGIREITPGYKRFSVAPHVGGGFTHMSASTVTPYGRIYVKWTAQDDKLTTLELEVPANTTCELTLPGKEKQILGSGKYNF